jgi:hypothetical protein
MDRSAKKLENGRAEEVWVVGYDSFHIILDGQLRRVHLYTAVDVVTRRLTASIVRFGDDREVPHEAA